MERNFGTKYEWGWGEKIEDLLAMFQQKAEPEKLPIPEEIQRGFIHNMKKSLLLIRNGLNLIEQSKVDLERITEVEKIVSSMMERKLKASQ